MRLKIITLLACAVLAGCKDKKTNSISETPVIFTKEAEGAIYKKDSLLVDQLDIEIADTPYERQTGLMYRESMKEKQGMWFVFKEEAPRAFYMKNTLMTLDIIYADKEGKVVSIIKNADPLNESSLPSDGPAMYVLELNGGSCDTWNIEVNDSIVVR
ncbi:DUF192 domain-containing protein [Robertkochia marina]|uniref:DUF192 domain-containing protein n=1 Tax=Robertkochia marina TaxID=1227945 RepID=A0A4S3LZL1_9FLAO|nr:DUF192 domain-containing protein [Robertkochia marina]THD65813.1 DUF192 domain-containing protein [Robertkochia marina]TRZ40815.1 DUF192 domain-containing protein [Robertkochia marina]